MNHPTYSNTYPERRFDVVIAQNASYFLMLPSQILSIHFWPCLQPWPVNAATGILDRLPINSTYTSLCLRKMVNIIKDYSHPGHFLIPSAIRQKIQMLETTYHGFKNSFPTIKRPLNGPLHMYIDELLIFQSILLRSSHFLCNCSSAYSALIFIFSFS